eukprot:g33599.t1
MRRDFILVLRFRLAAYETSPQSLVGVMLPSSIDFENKQRRTSQWQLDKSIRHIRLELKHNERLAWLKACACACVLGLLIGLAFLVVRQLLGTIRRPSLDYIPMTNNVDIRVDVPAFLSVSHVTDSTLTHTRVADWGPQQFQSADGLVAFVTARADFWTMSPKITVLVGIIKAEAHLKSYLSQLTTQTAFQQAKFLFLTAFQQAEFLFLTVREGGEGSEWCLDFVKAHANAALVRFNQDPGLYSMWNFGARVMGRGEAITNWNADDRKHPDSLRLHWNALRDNPSVMVVGSAVLVTYTPNLSWEQAAASKDTQTWWTDYGGGSPVLIGLQDLYLYNRFGAPRAPNNIMHNSPMWRKKLHDHIGYINEARYSSGADFAFWLSAARSLPGSLLFLPTPLELYYIHPNTYGREHEKDNPEAKNRLFSDFVPFIRYKRLRVLVTHEKFPSNKSGGDIRILGLLRWLVLRGYDVTLVSRGDMWQVSEDVEGGRLTKWGVKYYHHDLQHPNLDFLWHLGRFDVAFLSLWFWRCEELPIPELATPILQQTSPNIKLVVVSDDVHWLRDQKTSYCGKWKYIHRKEAEIYRMSDLVLTITSKDREAARSMILFPFVHDSLSEDLGAAREPLPQASRADFSRREGLLYVGSFHDGNRLGIAWFLESVFPLVVSHMKKKAAEGDKRWTAELITFKLVGDRQWVDWSRNATRFAYSNAAAEFTQFIPDQTSIEPFVSSALVFVSPSIISGTGISTKNMMAISKGMAMVTTPTGLDGFDNLVSFASEGQPVARTASDPQKFADHIIDLLGDHDAWYKQAEAASRYTAKHLSWGALDSCSELMALLQTVARRTQTVGAANRTAPTLPFFSRGVENLDEEYLADLFVGGGSPDDHVVFRSDGGFWDSKPEFPAEQTEQSKDKDVAKAKPQREDETENGTDNAAKNGGLLERRDRARRKRHNKGDR